MKVLVVDDDPSLRRLLAVLVGRAGHDVTEAGDGISAWERCQKEYFPLVMVDWLMPQMDGLELCRAIRGANRSKYTYVIVLTSLSGKSNFLKGMEAGADDFITKPFDHDELAARLRVAERILMLQEENRELSGLIPICMHCKHVRDDQNYWQTIERFLHRHTEIKLSHGVCPKCAAIHYPEIYEQQRARGESS
jgi:DNA-binding response OmpR family regulator